MKYNLAELSIICDGELVNCSAPEQTFIELFSTDTRKNCSKSLFVALAGENFDSHDFLDKAVEAGAIALCVNRAKLAKVANTKNIPLLVVDDTLRAYQNIARHHRRKIAPKILALTGSSGKTSTKEILAAILRRIYGDEAVYATQGNTNNHVGVPQNLLNLHEKHKLAIIEMGTNHFGEIETLSNIAEPDIGIIVSIGNAHLEFLRDTDGVATEKSAIFAKMNPKGTAIFPAECPGLHIIEEKTANFKKLRFGLDSCPKYCDIRIKYHGSTLQGSKFELILQNPQKSVTIEWPLLGKHQVLNAAAAVLGAMATGADFESAANALSKGVEIPGMRMRFENKDGIVIINDAYNANPDSVRAGIEWLAEALSNEEKNRTVHVILGDMLELGESSLQKHREVLDFAFKKLPAAKFTTVGKNMLEAVKSLNVEKVSLKTYANSDSAREIVKQFVPGDIVYLKGSRGIALEKIFAK
ncbi:MAG: UDP-N-acetylmuramoyl-tripeptide--D-alanyl-D-alanine ligase [Candidatus Nanoarchaeia archaeon]